MQDKKKYYFRLLCAVLIILAGIGWGVVAVIQMISGVQKVGVEGILIPALGLCVSVIGVLLLLYTRKEYLEGQSGDGEEADEPND